MASPDFDDEVAARAVAAHGVVCTWTPDGGQPVELLGIFENDYFDDTGSRGIQTAQAGCIIASAHAPNIQTGDAFTVRGQDYTIAIVKDDGAGMAQLALKRTT